MNNALGGFATVVIAAALSVVTAQVVWADEYAIVVGSYGDQGNAERARTSAQTQLRQRGINAPVRLLAANGRTRVLVAATAQNRQRLLQQLRQLKYPDAWLLTLAGQARPTEVERTPPKPEVSQTAALPTSPVPKATPVQSAAQPRPVPRAQTKKKPRPIRSR